MQNDEIVESSVFEKQSLEKIKFNDNETQPADGKGNGGELNFSISTNSFDR